MQRKGCEKIWGKCRKYKLQGKWTGQKCTTAETAPIVRIWCRPQATSFSHAATRPSFLASRCLSLQMFLTQYSGSFLQFQVDIWPAVWWDRKGLALHWGRLNGGVKTLVTTFNCLSLNTSTEWKWKCCKKSDVALQCVKRSCEVKTTPSVFQ